MIKIEFKINSTEIIFLLRNKPYYKDVNTIVMGFPYNMDCHSFSIADVEKVKGYYTYIKITSDNLTIINDIAGNYRMYYMKKSNKIYISDDFLTLFNLLDVSERIPDIFEIEYWDKHRYTTGEGTFVKSIKKFKPAHITVITENNINEHSYFKNIEHIPNREKHFEEILSDLRDSISIIKTMPQKKVLLFSGGADSTLLVKLLQEQKVDFIPVFGKITPANSMNFDDELKVKYSANKLGINVKELLIDANKSLHPEIVDIMFTDRAIAYLLFGMVEAIKKEFGNDVIILTGEIADSILNFGPTDNDIVGFIGRKLMFDRKSLINILFLHILKISRKRYCNCCLPKNLNEFLCSFFDDNAYKCIIDKSKSKDYYDKCLSIVNKYKTNLNYHSLMMYLKAFGFLQGSDQYVYVQAAEFYNLKIILNFATQKIIYSTIKNTDYKYEIYHPKSVVYKILKDVFNYKMPDIKKYKNYKKEQSKNEPFRFMIENKNKVFYEKLNSLEFAEEVKI